MDTASLTAFAFAYTRAIAKLSSRLGHGVAVIAAVIRRLYGEGELCCKTPA